MTNQEPFSFGSKHKGRHAGDLPLEQGGERPVREYDMPLDQAHEQHLTTPSTVEEGFQHQPLTALEQKALEKARKKQAKKDKLPAKRKRTFAIIGTSAVTIVAGGIGSYLAVDKNIDTDPYANTYNPPASAPEVPGEENEDIETEYEPNPDFDRFNEPTPFTDKEIDEVMTVCNLSGTYSEDTLRALDGGAALEIRGILATIDFNKPGSPEEIMKQACAEVISVIENAS